MYVWGCCSSNVVLEVINGVSVKWLIKYTFQFIEQKIVFYISSHFCHCKELKEFKYSNVSTTMEENFKISNSGDGVSEN